LRFVDTSYWVALVLRRHARHEEARSIWEAGPGVLICTNHVLGETWTFLRRRDGHRTARRFVESCRASPNLILVHVDEDLERDAWRWLRRHDERAYSFVDATSFALMRRRHLREAMAFDGDFSAAGFVEVRSQAT
jgi:predicted nucleic acid-binding protein